jgi:TRAP-type C4-dicarboxylate transport system substrate-binding protein
VYKIIVAESGSENTSNYAGHKAFKDYVEEKSGGRLIVEIYRNAQLGAEREAMESTQLGQITMMSTGLTQNTNFVPDMDRRRPALLLYGQGPGHVHLLR